jgi:hypothetical protein
MYSLPIILFAAIDSRTWSVDDVRAWADRLIMEASIVPEWLAELSLSVSIEEAAKSVGQHLAKHLVLPEDIAGLLVGMRYLRFCRGDMSWEQLVSEVGGIVDAYGAIGFDVEEWYEQTADPNNGIPLQTKRLLDDLASQAEACLLRLQDVRRAGDEFWKPASSIE